MTGNRIEDTAGQALLALRADQRDANVRCVVLHMIEKTARRAGHHLDIARELIDGQTGLGPR